jgi:hypothetical protein
MILVSPRFVEELSELQPDPAGRTAILREVTDTLEGVDLSGRTSYPFVHVVKGTGDEQLYVLRKGYLRVFFSRDIASGGEEQIVLLSIVTRG